MKLAHKIFNRLRRELRHSKAFVRAHMVDTQPNEEEVLDAWHKPPAPFNLQGCIQEWMEGQPCLFASDSPSDENKPIICRDADRIMAGSIPIFEQPCALKLPQLWHEDPLTHQSWPGDTHFTRFKVFHPSRDGVTDIRSLWEIGRFGWALPLAGAFVVTNDSKYLKAWTDYTENFIKENPPEFGPHWLNAMEVAIRAIQWCRALSLFFVSPVISPQSSVLSPLAVVLPSLLAHGKFIRSHLEWTHFGRTNHYLADLVGLLAVSVFVPQFRASNEWRHFAVQGLIREIEVQTDAEGFHAEASTAYHHFVLELYALTLAMERHHHLGFPPRFHERVQQMIETDRAIRGSENMDPRMGDDDSGGLGIPPTEIKSSKFEMDGDFNCKNSCALRASGIYILRSDGLSCHVACGPNGQQGVGGHAHNDKLSVVIRLKGREIIVDPGTFCYSADTALRDRFRSTAMHNTIMVDGLEQNPMKDWRKLKDCAHAHRLIWKDSPEETFFLGEHFGYRGSGIIHRRTIQLDKSRQRLVFLDELNGHGSHVFDFYLHFAPWLDREKFRLEPGRLILPEAEIIFREQTVLELLDTTCSPLYGQQVPNLTLHLQARAAGDWQLPWEFCAF